MPKKALVLTIDGWGTNLLGAYGNPLCQTVHIDKLAAQSLVFDRCYINSSCPHDVLESISTGIHPLEWKNKQNDLSLISKRITKLLTLRNRQSIFITDDKDVVDLDWVQEFNETFFFDPQPGEASNSSLFSDSNKDETFDAELDDELNVDDDDAERFEPQSDDIDLPEEEFFANAVMEEKAVDSDIASATESEEEWEWEEVNESNAFEPEDTSDLWKETRLAKFTEAALGELARFGETFEALPDLTWIHLSGLKLTWDAPYVYRLALCDEDDPRPTTSWAPASFPTDKDTDPDLVFEAVCGASAQGRVIDQIWSWIDLFVKQLANPNDLMIVIMGTRGYPLGEHDAVGFQNGSLFSENMHVPLIIKPGVLEIGSRCRRIVEPMSVYSTLHDWLLGASSSKNERSYSPSLLERLDDSTDAAIVAIKDQPAASLALSETSVAFQTPYWSAIWPNVPEPNVAEASADEVQYDNNDRRYRTPPLLYLAPDDRWQQNDVAVRAPEIVEQLDSAKEAYLDWICRSSNEKPPAIPEQLLTPVS